MKYLLLFGFLKQRQNLNMSAANFGVAQRVDMYKVANHVVCLIGSQT